MPSSSCTHEKTHEESNMRTKRVSINTDQFSGELKVLRQQVIQLKHIVDTKNITIKELREELADVKQDRSNVLLCWAEPSISHP